MVIEEEGPNAEHTQPTITEEEEEDPEKLTGEAKKWKEKIQALRQEMADDLEMAENLVASN